MNTLYLEKSNIFINFNNLKIEKIHIIGGEDNCNIIINEELEIKDVYNEDKDQLLKYIDNFCLRIDTGYCVDYTESYGNQFILIYIEDIILLNFNNDTFNFKIKNKDNIIFNNFSRFKFQKEELKDYLNNYFNKI